MKSQSSTPGAASRRTFMKQVGLGALAAAGAPRILRASDKGGTKPIIVGAGDHSYEVIHDWGQLPPNIKYGNTHGVCEDSQGRIYIHHTVGGGSTSDDTMVVFDSDGKFVGSWGKEYKGSAHGLHINKEGNEEFLYLCDYGRNEAVKTNLKGDAVWTIKAPMDTKAYATPEEFKPTNVAIAPNGDVYVADGYGKSWIHQYDSNARYIRSFGGPGSEPGKLSCPHGLMVDSRGSSPVLVVADRSNRRLQYFTLDGKHQSFVIDELRSPCHFSRRGGDLLIPDLEARVTIFDKNNKLVTHMGDGGNYALRDKQREEFIPGKFVAPHSAIFDHEGNIFVAEWVEVGRVTKLKKVSG